MTYDEYKENLTRAFCENGFKNVLDDDKAEHLCCLSKLLVETNKQYNLTAITDDDGIILKHFVDCASILRYLPSGSSVIDVGCGAGFPSLPIAILREDITVVSLDSTQKKISFVSAAANDLKLGNVEVVCDRAESFAKLHREQFDVCTSRAVARLNVLSELCLPLVKIGGEFVTMKSSKGQEELDEALNGIKRLGGVLTETSQMTFTYKGESIEREIFVFNKSAPTPSAYPRAYAQMLKKPL